MRFNESHVKNNIRFNKLCKNLKIYLSLIKILSRIVNITLWIFYYKCNIIRLVNVIFPIANCSCILVSNSSSRYLARGRSSGAAGPGVRGRCWALRPDCRGFFLSSGRAHCDSPSSACQTGSGPCWWWWNSWNRSGTWLWGRNLQNLQTHTGRNGSLSR